MAQVNGDIPESPSTNSVFVQHLLKYPVIKDGVNTFQQNQYGQKSLQLGDSAYKTFARPVFPYLSRPYQYVSPYLQKADQLGAQTLSRVDERFPVIKKPTGELYADAKSVVLFPYHKGVEGRDHAFQTYDSEYKKIGGEKSIVTYGKALVGTVFVLSGETLSWVSGFLSAKKADAKSLADSKANN